MNDKEIQLYQTMCEQDHELAMAKANSPANTLNAVGNLLSQDCGGMTVGNAIGNVVNSFAYKRQRLVDLELAMCAFEARLTESWTKYKQRKDQLDRENRRFDSIINALEDCRAQLDWNNPKLVEQYFRLIDHSDRISDDLQKKYDEILG